MNGRVYDPSLGRFLSVDPVFEFPTNTQSLNPYSYVLNNPLSMTDPTGYLVTCGSNQHDTNCGQAVSNLKPGQTTTQKVAVTPIGSHITTHSTITIGLTKGGNLVFSVGNGANLTQHVMEQGDKLAATSEKGSFTFRPNVEINKGTKNDLTPAMAGLLSSRDELYENPKQMRLGKNEINSIKTIEKYWPLPYPDPPGSDSSSGGYGTQLDAAKWAIVNADGGIISPKQADIWLDEFVHQRIENYISNYIRAPLTQGQYNAMVNYIYQMGSLGPRFRSFINTGDYYHAAWELNGQTVNGKFSASTWQRHINEQNEFIRTTPY